MKIAIIGIRGIPVVYSAFETFAERLGIDLAKKRWNVTIYCRSKYVNRKKKAYKGVCLIVLPSLESKNLSTLSHTFLSTLHACFFSHPEVILYLGVGNTPFSLLPRLFSIKTVVNINGMDWRRKKWGIFGKLYLQLSEFLTKVFPNAVITDSRYMENYYKKKYKKAPIYIPYGYFEIKKGKASPMLKKYGLKKEKYFVWVGRFVPENYLEEFVSAFKELSGNYKCVIIGDDLYESNYKRKIYEMANDARIVRTGFIPHELTLTLVKNSFAYIETKRSGGTHMTLVEAMGLGCFIISNNSNANKRILGTDALYYSSQRSLFLIFKKIINSYSRKEIQKFKVGVKRKAMENYRWEQIVKSYVALLLNVSYNKVLTRHSSGF